MMLADCGKETIEQADVGAPPLWAVFPAQVGQVAFEQFSVDSADVFDVDVGEEPSESSDGQQRASTACFEVEPA